MVTVADLVLGRAVTGLGALLSAVQFDGISLPIAAGLLIMMYRVLAKVRCGRLDSVTGDRKLMLSSLLLNWVVGRALMFALLWLLPPDLPEYQTGLIVCTKNLAPTDREPSIVAALRVQLGAKHSEIKSLRAKLVERESPIAVRYGQPASVPATDTFALLALLRRRLSDEEVIPIATQLIQQGEFPVQETDIRVVITKITKITTQMPSPDEVQRVKKHVQTPGWPTDDQFPPTADRSPTTGAFNARNEPVSLRPPRFRGSDRRLLPDQYRRRCEWGRE